MDFPGLLLIFLVIIIFGALALVIAQFFSREDELIEEAEEKLAEGEKDEATSLLSQVLDLNPANPKARWMLGRVLEVARNYRGAARQYQICLNNDTLPYSVSKTEALRRLKNLYDKANDLTRAIEVTDRLLDIEPDNPDHYLDRGRFFYRANRFERAVEDFQTLRDKFDRPPTKTSLYLARSYYRLDSLSRALDAYRDYMEAAPRDLDAILEAGRVAEEKDDYSVARSFYSVVRDKGDSVYFARAILSMIRIDLNGDRIQEAKELLDELDEYYRAGELPKKYELNFLYCKALWLEKEGRHAEALDIYKTIYDKNPDFKNVEKILEQEIKRMDEEDFLEQLMAMDREDFARMAEEITRSLGYKVINSDSFGSDEVNVVAHDETEMFKMDRILVTFKRWDQIVAEWPLKEFEIEMLEKRFDKGIFVSLRGFRPSAEAYAEQGNIELIGPDKLIPHLREAFKFYRK